MWGKIKKPDTEANNFRWCMEGLICNRLKVGESVTFKCEVNDEHDSLKVKYSYIGKDVIRECLNEAMVYYDFILKSLNDSSLIVENIKSKELQKVS